MESLYIAAYAWFEGRDGKMEGFFLLGEVGDKDRNLKSHKK